MRPISQKAVDTTWRSVARYSEARMGKEMRRFHKAQPDVIEFVVEFTQELDRDVAELAVYMAYVVWLMFDRAGKGGLRRIHPECIIDAYGKNEEWLGEYDGMLDDESIAQSLISTDPHIRQRNALGYVVQTLMETDEVSLTEDDRGYLFMLLKTFIDALDAV